MPVERDAAGWLDVSTVERLEARIEAASARASRTGDATLAVVTQRCTAPFDPAAVVLRGRLPGEDWGLIDQPDSDGSVVACIGAACRIESSGPDRFQDVAREWRRISGTASADAAEGPPGSGALAFGGFSFDDRGRSAGPWRDFGPASMLVPSIGFARRAGETHVTLQVLVSPEDSPSDVFDSILSRLSELDLSASLSIDPESADLEPRVESALPPEHYEAAVQRAVDAIRAGRIEKAVLAREVLVERAHAHAPEHTIAVLREVFPACFVFAVGRGDSVFLGASPELLVRRSGMQASTVALAGSTARSADPSVDDHLGERLMRSPKDRAEQAIVVQRIVRTLDPVSVWVTASDEPVLVKVANVQHLASPIRARLRGPMSAIELAGLLHPTPAVGGEPWSEAASVIAEVEGLDRGWYASPVGWTDGNGNGEFLVALRCALIRGSEARCYAGVGVVEGSDPAAELAETELKLQALVPVLAA